MARHISRISASLSGLARKIYLLAPWKQASTTSPPITPTMYYVPERMSALIACPNIYQKLQLDFYIEHLYVLLSSTTVPRAVIRVHAAGIHSSDYFNALHDYPGGV